MRLRTLIAPTMAQAMDMVRRECGDDAIIVSTETTDQGAKIIAALEEADDAVEIPGAAVADPLAGSTGEDAIDAVHEALLGHGLPNRLLERIVDASFLAGADDALTALAGALQRLFQFQPLGDRRPNHPIMLVGAPGAGKTVTIAKIAARAVFAKRKVRLITTDTVRAGAVDQLRIFATVMNLPLATAETDRQLAGLVDAAAPDELVLIDTAGVNPYSPRDMAELGGLVRATPVELIMVMAAAGDVVDAADQAQEFGKLGAAKMVATRLDMARRLGSLLAAAEAANLAFSDYSMTPAVADGLTPLDPLGLARMLMPHPTPAATAQPATRGLRS